MSVLSHGSEACEVYVPRLQWGKMPLSTSRLVSYEYGEFTGENGSDDANKNWVIGQRDERTQSQSEYL